MTMSVRLTCAAAITSVAVALAVPAVAATTQHTSTEPSTTTTVVATAQRTSAEPTPDARTAETGTRLRDLQTTDGASTQDSANGQFSDPITPIGAPSFLNDPDCVPAAEHPHPVLFLHGTTRNIKDFYDSASSLHNEGFCVWGYNYGKNTGLSIQNLNPSMYATGDIMTSVAEVSHQIDYVLEKSGADKVDLVGHSQGGMIPKAYIAKYGAEKVNRVVAMGAPFHGTAINGFGAFARGLITLAPHLMTFFLSPASAQQIIGSDFNAWLNAQPDTVPGVIYTSFFSPDDTVVTPNSTSELSPVDGADVANVNVKQACPFKGDKIIHDDLPTSPTMASLTYWALTRDAGETAPAIDACTALPNDELTWY